MSPLEVLLWAATVWAIFLAFVIVDVPDLVGRGAERLRQHHLPHWARHGHAPALDAPHHGRHAKSSRGESA